MSGFNRAITNHPWRTIAVFVALTGVLMVRIPAIHIDTDILSMMSQAHPVFVYNEWLEDYFAIEDPGVMLVINEGENGVFTPHTLSLVAYLSEAMAELESIDGDDLVSLSAVDNITSDGDSLLVDPFFDLPPRTLAEAHTIRSAVFDNPMMVGTIVSRDGTATAVIGEMNDGDEKEALYDDLRAIVAAAPITDERVLVAGQAVVEGQLGILARRDISFMFPFVLLTTGVVMLFALGSVRGAALSLLIVFVSVIWTLGVMGWTNSALYPVTVIIPIVLVAIGVADGIHITHRFLLGVAAKPEQSATETAFETVEEMAKPVVMAALTTAAGLCSLVTSTIPPLQSFGMFAAVGVLAAMVFSLTILPALLCVLPLPLTAARRVSRVSTRDGGLVALCLNALTRLVTKRPLTTVNCGLALVLVGVSGIPNIVVDGSMLRNFPPTNPVRAADREFVDRFGGSVPMEIVLDGGGVDAWKEPEKLRAVEGLQRSIEASDYAGETRSIVDYIKRMNSVMKPDDDEAYRVPDSQDLIAQYLLLYSISGEPDDFDDVVDYDYRLANVRVQLSSDHSPVAARALSEVQAYADAHLAPLGITTTASGRARTLETLVTLLVQGQIQSLLMAVILVACLTGFMCRSALGGLLTATPVAIATLLNFGVLGWSGEPLGITTAIMSSLAIGIGVDYAIHFVVKYQACRRRCATLEAAMRETLGTAGIAIFFNCAVVVAGFLVLASSEFPPNRSLGLLVALNMIVCLLGTVTLLAAVLHRLQPAFVRRAVEPVRAAASCETVSE